jgi:hypothetical protein
MRTDVSSNGHQPKGASRTGHQIVSPVTGGHRIRQLDAVRGIAILVVIFTTRPRSTGLPDSIFRSVDHFDNFLSHGCLDHHLDPSSFRVEALNSTQYDALAILTKSYVAAGYEWFTPVVRRSADQDNLAKRFAG